MGITTVIGIVMAVLLVCGVLAWLLAPNPPDTAKRPVPLGVFVLCTVAVVAFVFYLSAGYGWLAGVAGQGVSDAMFWVFSVVAPLLAMVVCGVCFWLNRRRLAYFMMAWACLLLGIVGLGAVGLGAM